MNERLFLQELQSASPEKLAKLIRSADGDAEELLRRYYGAERFARIQKAAFRSAEVASRRATVTDRPNVVVVPGIMGSELSLAIDGGSPSVLWLSIVRLFLLGKFSKLGLKPDGVSALEPNLQITANGLIRKFYDDLELSLLADWNVRHFPYDWRKDIRVSAAELEAFIASQFGSSQPVNIVAHSMGGLVARMMIARRLRDGSGDPELVLNKGRLVMLGTPNHGSFEVPLILTGLQDTVMQFRKATNAASAFTKGAEASRREVLKVVNSFPSVYQMLPVPERTANPALTKELYQSRNYSNCDTVDSHFEIARETQEQLASAVIPEIMAYVAGCNFNTETAIGLSNGSSLNLAERGSYQFSEAGDGRVSHQLGRLDGVPMYFVTGDHGGLPENQRVLQELNNLLRGDPTSLSTSPTSPSRGAAPPLPTTPFRSVSTEDLIVRLQEASAEGRGGKLALARATEGNGDLAAALDEDSLPSLLLDEELELQQRLTAGLLGIDPDRQANSDGAVEPAVREPLPIGPDGALPESQPEPQSGASRPERKVTIRLAYEHIESPGIITDNSEFPPVDCLSVGHYAGVRTDSATSALDKAISRAVREKAENEGAAKDNPPLEQRLIHQMVARNVFRGLLAELFFVEDQREISGGNLPRRSVAVVGMGTPDTFGPPELTLAVRQLCWTLGFMGKKHLATVMYGGRRGGMSIRSALNAWLRGLGQALKEIPSNQRDGHLTHVTIVEYDYEQAWQMNQEFKRLQQGSELNLDDVQLVFEPWTPDQEAEFKRRAADERRRNIDKMSSDADDGQKTDNADETTLRMTVSSDVKLGNYRFALLTPDASIPERSVALDARIIAEANDRLVARSTLEEQFEYGELLTRLVVPRDFRAKLQSAHPLVLVLDATTARIHWEMLTTLGDGITSPDPKERLERFLGQGRGMTRQFRTVFAPTPEPIPDANRNVRVLIVADPAAHAPLKGAKEEAVLLADLFDAFNAERDKERNPGEPHRGKIHYKLLMGPRQARRVDVLKEVMLVQYDVLHFCGHCTYNPDNPAASGWIFGRDAAGVEEILSAAELDRIDRVPRLVFSNACESGITPERAGERATELPAAFAEAFFARGVQNFICTGWPVNDLAAREFACEVYAALLSMKLSLGGPGRRSDDDGESSVRASARFSRSKKGFSSFHEALADARERLAVTSHGLRTWGAYQHYGNPFSRLFPPGGWLNNEREGTSQPRRLGLDDNGQPADEESGGGRATAPSPTAESTTAPDTSPPAAQPSGDRFARVRSVIAAHGSRLQAEHNAVLVRPGFVVQNDWVTDTPAVVVVVPPRDPMPSPMEIDGVPVDFAPATPLQVATAEGLAPPPESDERNSLRLPRNIATEELLQPGDTPQVQPPSEEDRARVITQPYKPPKRLSDALNEDYVVEQVVAHLSPDAGWQVLGEFIEGAERSLTIGMYDFTAPHIVKAVAALRQQTVALVLDPSQALDNGGDPKKNAKANDMDEDDVVAEFRRRLKDDFTFAWAAVKVNGKTIGSTFPSAYHIKVAVRDDRSFWLSSGNWQSSNQAASSPDDFDGTLAEMFARHNREWHVVVDSPKLTKVYRRFLEFDLQQAAKVQDAGRGASVERAELPELFIPDDEEERKAADLKVFEPQTFDGRGQGVKLKALLTPDNYAEEVLKVIKKARKSLFFQNQYIKIGKVVAPEFQKLLEALKDKINNLDDAGVILRKLPGAREMVEVLVAQGFRADRIRLMANTHTKGIIVDSKVAVVGSHNWSSDGVTANRDASLIIHDAEVAAYYERAFAHDWQNLAKAQVFSGRTMPRVATKARSGEAIQGGAIVPWGAVEEE